MRRAPARKKRASAPPRSRPTPVPRFPHPSNPWILPLCAVALLLFLGWQLYPVARMDYREQRNRDQLRQQLQQLRDRNVRLKGEVERLKTPRGVEDAARQLGLARKGEQVWVTTPQGSANASAPASTSPAGRADVGDASALTRALDFVFGVGQ